MFCDRFKALRKQRGFSQTKVATDFAVAQSTIASWELGTRSPVMEMIPLAERLPQVLCDHF